MKVVKEEPPASIRMVPVVVVRTWRVRLGAALLSAAVVAVGLGIQLADQLSSGALPDGLVSRFGLNDEGGVPAAWSALALIAVAALLALEGVLVGRRGESEGRWWLALAALFVLLGLEEFLAVHELTIEPLRAALGVGGLLYYAWVVPGTLALLAVGLAFAGFVRRMPRSVRRPLLRGAALMAVGALGFEAIGGWWVSRDGEALVRILLFTVEEALELAGAVVVLWGLLARLDGARVTPPTL